jgi:Mg/Co/Ni transporter MgtE
MRITSWQQVSRKMLRPMTAFEHTKARLSWLVLALLGGFISVKVLGLFEGHATTRKFISHY